MENQSKNYAIMGLNALIRAARKAIESATKKNLKVPIWKDGKIEYIKPKINTEQGAPPDRYSAGAP
jgi:hypothetical protein